eukprot:TRINITY_DN23378_c0_g1_i1.p1 TRINITY_DN23378_c0_g1~~TRINITY_DN23378_c0_g1_i1.p1  ORF type:complete len:585 (+),score=156.06 TRINITY_DN23378_c0_g1_i1:71-1825(+)
MGVPQVPPPRLLPDSLSPAKTKPSRIWSRHALAKVALEPPAKRARLQAPPVQASEVPADAEVRESRAPVSVRRRLGTKTSPSASASAAAAAASAAAALREAEAEAEVEDAEDAGAEACEAIARRALAEGDVSAATVERALAAAEVPFSANRKNVIPSGEHAVRGAVCGLYFYSYRLGISSFALKRPWLTKLLAAFARAARPDFPFTAIQVNVNYAARPHVDRNNLGRSLIIGLGDYEGGRLWVEDAEGDEAITMQETIRLEAAYRTGTVVNGRAEDVRQRWLEFDGNRLHFTKPFSGTRYSLVYFTCDRVAETPPRIRKQLRSMGFNLSLGAATIKNMVTTKKVHRRTVRKERFSQHRGIVEHLQPEDRLSYVQQNPKVPGSVSHGLFERYKRAQNFAEAKQRGARAIDFRYDYNQGYMKVVGLQTRPIDWELEVRDPAWKEAAAATMVQASSGSSASAVGAADPKHSSAEGSMVRVRVKELSPKHAGVEVPLAAINRLLSRVPTLQSVPLSRWATPDAEEAPLAAVPLTLLRTLLHWAEEGVLCFSRSHKKELRDVLASWGEERLAGLVADASTASAKQRAGR